MPILEISNANSTKELVAKNVIALTHNINTRRHMALNEIEDYKTLKYIALNDPDYEIKKTALQKINAESMLFEIFTTYISGKNLYEIKSINLIELLYQIIEKVDLKSLRKSIEHKSCILPGKLSIRKIKKIRNQKLLLIIALVDRYEGNCTFATERIYDENELLKIVGNCNFINTKVRATSKIEDFEKLKLLIKNRYPDIIKTVAANKIKDQDVIKELVAENLSSYVKENLVYQITDQEFLYNLLSIESDEKVRAAIKFQIRSPELLRDILLDRAPTYISKSKEELKHFKLMAIKKINDEETIRKVAITAINSLEYDQLSEIKIIAIEKLHDQDILEKIYVQSKNRRLKLTALKNMTNQEIMIKTANESDDEYFRLTAINNITNHKILESFARYDSNGLVRQAAVKSIKNEQLLEYLAIHDKQQVINKQATKRLRSAKHLRKIALESPIALLREIATIKIAKYGRHQDILYEIATSNHEDDIDEENVVYSQLPSMKLRSLAISWMWSKKYLRTLLLDSRTRHLAKERMIDLKL